MFAGVKTNYMFSSTDTLRADSEKARRALEAVREAVRVSKMIDTSNVATSLSSETAVLQAVETYFSEPKFSEFSIHQEYEISIGHTTYMADIVLRDAEGRFAAIAECKLLGDLQETPEPLKNFLDATDAPFGIFASGVGRNSWHFYENLHDNQFRLIEQSDFETKILEMSAIGELT